ncbi:MAG: hypothetical protein F6K00_12175 [Leptolyngbya sp. SIOISBB]|nr:hypothetical protein [Leptolyngbya sp. SIOISBB]
MAGAIALILISPTIEAKIFPPAGVAYVAPPPGYNLNIRSGPGTHYPAINTLGRGTPISVTGHYEHGWAQLADRSWVAGNLINSRHPVSGGSGHHPGVPSLAYIAGNNNVNIRSGPGIQYPVVITLPPGAEIRITGFYEHGWAQLEDLSWVASNLIQVGVPINPGPIPDATLRVGSRGPQVIEVEIRLQELRYVTNDFIPDDYYGTDTEQAVKNFQFWNNLPVDGAVGAQTRERLFSANAIPNPYEPPPDFQELRLGMRSPDVRRLEARLQDLDYFRGLIPDELFDQDTEDAVRNFQQRNGLPVNGVATVTTQELLFSDNAIRNEEPIDPPAERPTLRLGDRDPAVRELEIRLQDLDYLRGVVADSLFGPETETAVRNFQERNNLPINGVADPVTQEVLYSSNAIPNEEGGTDPPNPDPGENQATVRTNDGSDAIAFTGPGIENDLAAFIPNGTIVTLTGTIENNWYELEDGNWLEGSFLVF